MFLVLLVTLATALVPEFKDGTYSGLLNSILVTQNTVGRYVDVTIAYGYTFRDVPQVAIAISKWLYEKGTPGGIQIQVISRTKTNFVFRASEHAGKDWTQVIFYWYAFNDDTIQIQEIKLQTPTLVVGNNVVPKAKFADMGILILSGYYVTCNPEFYATISAYTDTTFTINFQSTTPSCISWVQYTAIIGNSISLWVSTLQNTIPPYTLATAKTLSIAYPSLWLQYDPVEAHLVLVGFKESAGRSGKVWFEYDKTAVQKIDYFINIFSEVTYNSKYAYCAAVNNYKAYYQVFLYRLVLTDLSCDIIEFNSQQLPHARVTMS